MLGTSIPSRSGSSAPSRARPDGRMEHSAAAHRELPRSPGGLLGPLSGEAAGLDAARV